MLTAIPRLALNALFSLSTFLLVFTLAWIVLAKFDFMYPVWHDIGGIGKGIDKYGPQNRFKPGFGETTKAQRAQIFSEINIAVHSDGEGLEKIEYTTPTSAGVQLLLRRDEIIHLRDVAHLISILKVAVVINALLWVVLVLYQIFVIKRFVSLKNQIISVLCSLFLGLSILLAVGPVKVFNQLHIWIFPDEHKWFFFYQDSLMSTLMMAPTLFGWIAGALVLLTLFMYVAIFLLRIFFRSEKVRS